MTSEHLIIIGLLALLICPGGGPGQAAIDDLLRELRGRE